MFFFNLYSWITGIMWAGGELLPQFIRNPLFKVLLKSYGKNSMIDYKTYIRYPAQVRIGSGTTINRGCQFFTSYHCKDVEISIGNHVAVAPNVRSCTNRLKPF